MAEPRTGEKREQQQGLERAEGRGRMARRDPFDIFGGGPFTMMRRMQDEMDRLFGSLGFGPGPLAGWGGEQGTWTPAVEVFQRGQEFVVRADVPGLTREDLSVELGEDTVTISGERKYDHQEEEGGVFRSERAYGAFQRIIPLPEGVITDSAKATFRDGVLEIVMQAPPQEVRKGRRIEIGEERAAGSGRTQPQQQQQQQKPQQPDR
jgi:HSP20 family protein